jgi:tetratricopeptide (TPR) repeat protein
MGLFFARTRRTPWDEPSASITWREYVAALSAATDPGDRGHGPGRVVTSGLPYLGVGPEETALAVFSEQVRRNPEDETAHRLLGLTHLARGRIRPAVRHLEIAFRLVRRHAPRAVGLTDALQLQCEAARLRLVLIRLYMRLGRVDRACSLAQEAQVML